MLLPIEVPDCEGSKHMRYKMLFSIALLILLAACGKSYDIETNMSEEMKSFSFTDQNDEPFGLDDLEGKWWVADLVFTNCTTVCLPMTTNMSSLQDMLDEEDIDVELVSFSVDPDHDTPDVLKEYADEYDADESNWHFLTGYDFHTIKKISVKSFRQLLKEPQEGDDQVTHGTTFVLVDPDGDVIKEYDGQIVGNMEEIVDDLKTVMADDNEF